MRSWSALAAASVIALCGAASADAPRQADVKPAAQPSGKTVVAARRITESQYRHAIIDAFGPDLAVNARFEPGRREDGLLAVGNQQLSITSSGFEQYYALAKSIADQALDPKRRDKVMPCKPADAKAADAACARQFIDQYGAALFRRPLTGPEVDARVKVAVDGAGRTGDFHEGLKLSLVSLLMAPEFLFRIETAEPDPAKPGQLRLDGYSKAARLSYLLWDAQPDAELTAAAARGELHTQEGLDKQLTRMTASPRMEAGVRAFFADMLQLDHLDGMTKDSATYPKFSATLIDSAREQTLRTIVSHLVKEGRDYRDIFTSRDTVVDRHLAAVYQAPFLGEGGWAKHTFPAESDRAGVLTDVAFLSMFAHPAASSPTRRGVKINEIFRCSPTPEPPADVDFSKVQATANGTVRVRLTDHMNNPGCAACHRMSDPLGLAMERFDGLGQSRMLENGVPIDVSAELGGKTFSGAAGVGQWLRDDKKTASCLVKNMYAYGVGRATGEDDEDYLARQTKAFAADGHKVAGLFKLIGASPEFFSFKAPERAKPAPQTVAAASIPGGVR